MSETQVHNYADTEREWDISIKCQWLHHCSGHCQQLHNVFHISVNKSFPLGQYCQLLYPSPLKNSVTDPYPTAHICIQHLQVHKWTTTINFFSQFLLCFVLWPSPDLLLTPCFSSPPDIFLVMNPGSTWCDLDTERCPVHLKTTLTILKNSLWIHTCLYPK